jgi:DNA-directed RNA polymerase specialized sigma subunit
MGIKHQKAPVVNGPEVVAKLVEEHIFIVHMQAKNFKEHIDYHQLVSIGMERLQYCAERWIDGKGSKFVSWANAKIKWGFIDYIDHRKRCGRELEEGVEGRIDSLDKVIYEGETSGDDILLNQKLIDESVVAP